jgi:hypothetical protein
VSWVTSLRLAYWERSRLYEIYTAHLIRNTVDFSTHHAFSARSPQRLIILWGLSQIGAALHSVMVRSRVGLRYL